MSQQIVVASLARAVDSACRLKLRGDIVRGNYSRPFIRSDSVSVFKFNPLLLCF